jgi:hypothetical protein
VTLTVTDNDGLTDAVTKPVTVALPPGPAILVTPTVLEFVAQQGSDPIPNRQTFTVTNIGSSTLSWRAREDSTWLSLQSSSGTLEPGQSDEVRATVVGVGSLDVGAFTAEITVSDPNAVNSPQTVLVRVTVLARPLLQDVGLDAPSLGMVMETGFLDGVTEGSEVEPNIDLEAAGQKGSRPAARKSVPFSQSGF